MGDRHAQDARSSHGRPAGHRAAQLCTLVQRIVQTEIQRGIADPRVRGMVTVIGVDPSADLEEATVRVSVLPAEFGPLAVQGLNHAAAHLRGPCWRGRACGRRPACVSCSTTP